MGRVWLIICVGVENCNKRKLDAVGVYRKRQAVRKARGRR